MFPGLEGIESAQVRRLTRAEYDRLVEAGTFANEDVELVRGVIVRMVPHGAPHAGPVQRLTTLLVPKLLGRAHVRVQLPVNAPDESEPQPDFAVVEPRDFDDVHPSSAFLIVEVSDSSLRYDRATKASLYAEMGVPEYWIVNVQAAEIEVHTDPSNGRYRSVRTLGKGASIELVAFRDVTIDVADVVR